MFPHKKRRFEAFQQAIQIQDVAGVRQLLQAGIDVNLRGPKGMSLLRLAVQQPEVNAEILAMLLEAGADFSEQPGTKQEPILHVALKGQQIEAVAQLLAAGADPHVCSEGGYSSFLQAAFSYENEKQLCQVWQLLLNYGADPNQASSYGELAIKQAAQHGRWDALRFLIRVGAETEPLRWNSLMKATVFGSLQNMEQAWAAGADLQARDCWERTPLLLAVMVGSLEKVQWLVSAGADLEDCSRLHETALTLAAQRGWLDILTWLLAQGMPVDQVVEEEQPTALMEAARYGHAAAVKLLLQAGADPWLEDGYQQSTMSYAGTPEVVRLLAAEGLSISQAEPEVLRRLFGTDDLTEFTVSAEEYQKGRRRRFGCRNPQKMEIPFWEQMVRLRVNSWAARTHFHEEESFGTPPVWCFQRYGATITALPDGRFVEIGGEHEDYYDPDFCIYNEVVVYDGAGDIEIYGYPEAVFPPTDFHSATLWNGFLYLTGRLGYQHQRDYGGVTPVFRLNLANWQMERVATSGTSPGWIFKHTARLLPDGILEISGGEVLKLAAETEDKVETCGNAEIYHLHLKTGRWELRPR